MPPGDVDPVAFRAALHQAADLMADYVAQVHNYDVVPKIQPGDVRKQLPAAAPEQPEPLDALLRDYKALIEPNTTHWNHPGFMAYFAVTGSGPGILGEMLAAALNVNAMLWRTGPAPTELEEHTCDWVRQLLELPSEFRGHINDTASISSLLALAAARQRLRDLDVRHKGLAGRPEAPPLMLYASDQAHSSIEKAAVVLGLGLNNVRKIPTDDRFRMDVRAFETAVLQDKAAGRRPMAAVATVGTTSTTSVDPVPEIAAICRRENLWLHVDAAYAGVGAMVPELRAKMPGLELADSIVTNPHKWLFVPVDCSLLFVRDVELLKETFSIVPHYLTTSETAVTNLMDLGVQLGRRFRALKLWMVIRGFGAEGLRARIRYHCALAQEFARWIEQEEGFKLVAPVPFSTVCFRATPPRPPEVQDWFNERLIAEVNRVGPVFLSHTSLRGRYTGRLTIGNLRTGREHVQTAQRLLRETRDRLLRELD